MKFIIGFTLTLILGINSILLFSYFKYETVRISGEDFKAILIANNYLANRANLTESEIKTPMPEVMFLEHYGVKVSRNEGTTIVYYFSKHEGVSGGAITLTIDMKKETVSSIVYHK